VPNSVDFADFSYHNTELIALATAINAEHAAVYDHTRSAIHHARAAGEKLRQAKAQVAHGHWLTWLKTYCPQLSKRTAQAYMQLAKGWTVLADQSSHDIASWTIDHALRQLADLSQDDDRGEELAAQSIQTPLDNIPFIETVPALSLETLTALFNSLPLDQQQLIAESVPTFGVVSEKRRFAEVSQDHHDWYTPADCIEAARQVMGDIDLDPASSDIAQRTVKAARWYTIQTNGLNQPWHGRIWLNPPYQAMLLKQFTQKAIEEYRSGRLQQAVILTHSATDTGWFHDLALEAKGFVLTQGRIRFYSPIHHDSGSPHRGQAFFYFGPNLKTFTQHFAAFGLVVTCQPVKPLQIMDCSTLKKSNGTTV